MNLGGQPLGAVPLGGRVFRSVSGPVAPGAESLVSLGPNRTPNIESKLSLNTARTTNAEALFKLAGQPASTIESLVPGLKSLALNFEVLKLLADLNLLSSEAGWPVVRTILLNVEGVTESRRSLVLNQESLTRIAVMREEGLESQQQTTTTAPPIGLESLIAINAGRPATAEAAVDVESVREVRIESGVLPLIVHYAVNVESVFNANGLTTKGTEALYGALTLRTAGEEAQVRISKECPPGTEGLTRVVVITVCILEALRESRASAPAPLEILTGSVNPAPVPTESKAAISMTVELLSESVAELSDPTSVNSEALAFLLHTPAASVEAPAAALGPFGLPLESAGQAAANYFNNHEFVQNLIRSTTIDAEGLAGVQRPWSRNTETSEGIKALRLVLSESTVSVQAQTEHPDENAASLTASALAGSESVVTLLPLFHAGVEDAKGAAPQISSNMEAGANVQGATPAASEAAARALLAFLAGQESLTIVLGTTGSALETARVVTSSPEASTEAPVGSQANRAQAFEALAEVRDASAVGTESVIPVTVYRVLNIGSQAGAANLFGIVVEAIRILYPSAARFLRVAPEARIVTVPKEERILTVPPDPREEVEN